MSEQESRWELAAKTALAEVSQLLEANPDLKSYETSEGTFDNQTFIGLLDKCFHNLDRNNDGISRAELLAALTSPSNFSKDEFVMLSLLAKYFSLIANMVDDQPGEESKITLKDKAALADVLSRSKLSLAELHLWCFTRDGTVRPLQPGMGPPPLTGSGS